jgi:DNA-binding MarR family transcriptional regulator
LQKASNLPGVQTTSTDVLEEIAQALTRVVRGGNQPRLHEVLMAKSGVRLERSAYWVISRLGDAGAIRLSDLAPLLGIDLSTVSRQVQALEQQGLVQRAVDSADRRAVRLELTALGKRTLTKLRQSRRQMMSEALADWSDDDKDDLARLLNRFVDDLGKLA